MMTSRERENLATIGELKRTAGSDTGIDALVRSNSSSPDGRRYDANIVGIGAVVTRSATER
jgi:hypothetical protein